MPTTTLDVRIGVALEQSTDQYLCLTDEGADEVDFVEYGVFVSAGVPGWVERLHTGTHAALNLHPLDVNLGGEGEESERWRQGLASLVRSTGARSLVSDTGYWFLGESDATWPRPSCLAQSAAACGRAASRLAEACGVPFRVENPPIEWHPRDASVWQFLDEASSAPGVEICLDLSHLIQFERNVHGRVAVLPERFPWARVSEIHIAGYVPVEYGGKVLYLDEHASAIDDEQLRLLARVLELRGDAGPLDVCLEMEPHEPAHWRAEARRVREYLSLA